MNKTLHICWSLVLSLLLLPFVVQAQAPQATRGSILIISSYNPDARRISEFVSEFETHITRSDIPYDIFVETLECKNVADAPLWIAQTNNLLTRYIPRNLGIVILLGQEAWSSFVSLGRFPENVMIFSCFASSNGIMLPAPGDSVRNWMPQSVDYLGMMDSIKTVGGLLNKYNIRNNIELVRSLYPEVNTLAFVSDNTYGGISIQALMRKEMENYPDLNLVLVDSRRGEELARKTYAELPARSAVLLGTWRVGEDGEYLMQRSLNDLVLVNPRVPVFSVTKTGIGDVAVGGYVPEYENGAKAIVAQIDNYLQSKDNSSTYFNETGGVYQFDSRKLSELKIATYALPSGSVVEDTVAAKLSRYSYYIELLVIGIFLLCVILIFVVWLFMRTRRLTNTLREREEQLVIAREHAEESDMLKSAFLANMSHEIRTPLNAIMGFSSLMQSGELSSEERAEYCSIVVHNSEMLLTLLNDILDISSLECGRIRFNYAPEEIIQLCHHTILTTAHTRQAGVEVHFESDVKSFMLTTDSHRLSQILINLLTNAGKFTAKGSITLAVNIDRAQGLVLFSVADTGSGIPIEKQHLVFNRFEKLEGNKKKGTGLGLAICHQIALIIGGDIQIDSTYTNGARFVFSHPIDIPIKEDGENPMGGGGFHPLNSSKVLRVDENGRLARR